MNYPMFSNNNPMYMQNLQSLQDMRDRIDSQIKSYQQTQMQQPIQQPQIPQVNQTFQLAPNSMNNELESKYYDIEEYIKYHEFDKELIEFEENIQKKDKVLFLMYKYRFKEHKTFSEISELLDIETNRITTELDKIAFGMRIFCKI